MITKKLLKQLFLTLQCSILSITLFAQQIDTINTYNIKTIPTDTAYLTTTATTAYETLENTLPNEKVLYGQASYYSLKFDAEKQLQEQNLAIKC